MAFAPPRRHARWMILLALVTAVTFWFTEQRHLLHGYFNTSAAEDPWEWMEGNDAMVPSVHNLDDYGAKPVHAASKGRILITGGGGVIGKALISRLLSTKTPITVLDKVFYDNELEALKRQHPNSNLRFIEGDIRDPSALSAAMTDDIAGVIHLAAVSRVLWCIENEKDCEDVNVRGTELVLDALPKRSWFIQASSREVYGNPKHMPVREDTPHAPANVYGATKAKAEDVINAHIKEFTDNGSADVNVIMLRLSNVYGSAADHRERLIPSIMTNALSHRTIQIVGGDQVLDMINIRDVVNAFAAAVNRLNEMTYGWNRKRGQVEVFNVGTSSPTPALEIIRKVLWLTNSSSPIQTLPIDDRFPNLYEGSTQKATNVLGFTASVTMDDGLHSLARQYLGETYQFLKRKQTIECGPRPKYSIKDILFLDGCTGLLAAEYEGRPVYASYDPPWNERPELMGWRDDDKPPDWKFDIKAYGENKATLKMSRPARRRVDEKEVDYEVNFKANGPDTFFSLVDTFVVEVDPDTGYVSLTDLHGNPIAPIEAPQPHLYRRNYFGDGGVISPLGKFRFRITPLCCAGKPSPWPFFKEDPLASNVLDQRSSTMTYFNASRITTLCHRLSLAESFAKDRLDQLASEPLPIRLELAPLPTGRPADWRFRGRDVCSNLCDHPTICLDTGDCACGQAACVRRPRFPFKEFANLPYFSYPPRPVESEGVAAGTDPMVLVNAVERSTWLNMLHPHARRYFNSNPANPKFNVTVMPEDRENDYREDQEHYERIKTEWHGCFSADSALVRGVREISHPYEKGDFVMLPQYSYIQKFPEDMREWFTNAENHLPESAKADFDRADMVVPFSFDWGRCQTVMSRLYGVRGNSKTPLGSERVTAWQPMGDTNSQCYNMDQDVVVPARTCLQEELKEAFGDMKNVKPSRQRGVLTHFKGSDYGAGTTIRKKISCDRPWREDPQRMKLTGAEKLETYWQGLKKANPNPHAPHDPKADYLATIGDTVFCMVPRGTTGWSTRPMDAMYAGCIPVLVGDMTHFPFWDILDWSKFSIHVDDSEMDHLEDILTSYTWDEVHQLQTNLMLIRDAALYPNEGHMDESLKYRSPLFFAIHSTWLLQHTRFPTN